MQGHDGLLAALLAWRGFIALVVPLINTKLQSKFTELLVASPSVANDIVQKKWYQTIALTLRMTIGILLPTTASVIVRQAAVDAHQGNAEIYKRTEIKPPAPPPNS